MAHFRPLLKSVEFRLYKQGGSGYIFVKWNADGIHLNGSNPGGWMKGYDSDYVWNTPAWGNILYISHLKAEFQGTENDQVGTFSGDLLNVLESKLRVEVSVRSGSPIIIDFNGGVPVDGLLYPPPSYEDPTRYVFYTSDNSANEDMQPLITLPGDMFTGEIFSFQFLFEHRNDPDPWEYHRGAERIFFNYEQMGDCPPLGDLNNDGAWNVQDIVILAGCILNTNCIELDYGCAGDLSGDNGYNVLDIVTLVNCVLDQTCGQ